MMNYYIFHNQFLTHFMAVEPGTTNTLEVVFNGNIAQTIKYVEAKPFCGYGQWKPSTLEHFQQAYQVALMQMNAMFQTYAGDGISATDTHHSQISIEPYPYDNMR